MEKTTFNKGLGWGFAKYVSRSYVLHSEIIEILLNGNLTLCCNICKYIDSTNISGQCLFEENVSNCKILDNLELLLKNEQLSDIKLSVNGKIFKVHKVMLGAQSSVFKAMFEHNMKEVTKGVVEICDVNHEVIEQMLQFMYTGKVKNIEKLTNELLVVSDKYDIKDLKIICENYLCKNLSTDNILDILLLADIHKAIRLKSQAILFMAAHSAEIINKPEFEIFKNSNLQLIAEAFCALAKMK